MAPSAPDFRKEEKKKRKDTRQSLDDIIFSPKMKKL